MSHESGGKRAHTLRKSGARYVVDAECRPVAVLLTLEEYEHYLDLLDDEEDSQDPEIATRLSQAAEGTSVERCSFDEYLQRRANAEIQR